MKKFLSMLLTASMLLTLAAPVFTEDIIAPPDAGSTAQSAPAGSEAQPAPAGSEVSAPTLLPQEASSQNVAAIVDAGEAIEAPANSENEVIDNAAEGESMITGTESMTGELLSDTEPQDGAVDLSGKWLDIDSAAALSDIQNAPAKATYYIAGSALNRRENTVVSIDGMRVYMDVTMKDIKLSNGEAVNGTTLLLKSAVNPYANVGFSVFSSNGSNASFPKDKRNRFLADANSLVQAGINFTNMPDGAYQIWMYYAHFESTDVFRYQAPDATYRVVKAGKDLYFDRPQAYYYNENGLKFISQRVGMEEALSLSDFQDAAYEPVKQMARDITKNCANEVEKAQVIHDWVANNIAYDYEGLANKDKAIYDALQTFNRRRGVCSGLSRLMNVMLRAVNVPCVSIQGRLASGGKTTSFERANEDFRNRPEGFMNHEWNAVYVAGEWFYIDATSDTGSRWYGKPSQNVTAPGAQTYFAQGLDAFALSHIAMRVGVYDNEANTIKPSEPSTGPSAAQVRAFVTRLYKNVLERDPDANGLNNWVNTLMSQKGTAGDVVASFFLSPEFSGRTLTNEQRVTIAYKTMLDREPDADGAAVWVKALNSGMSMRFIAYGFVYSPEFTALCKTYGIPRGEIKLVEPRDMNMNISGFVQRLYKTCLGRESDISGINTWCGCMLDKTKTAKEVAHDFIFSPEFINIKYSNTDFIKQLYRAFMGREYDSKGLADWNARMDKGMGREQVFGYFADSKEFGEIRASFGV
ncbi:MAG: DUF4214 domain-containing protein [Ruthenibacterium sp.]